MEKIKTDGKEMFRVYSAINPWIDAVIFVDSNDVTVAKNRIKKAISEYYNEELCYGDLIEKHLEDIKHDSIYRSSSDFDDEEYKKQLDVYYKKTKLRTHYIHI